MDKEKKEKVETEKMEEMKEVTEKKENSENNEEKEGKKLEAYDYDSIAVNMVQFQVEYHFSDANLAMDNYLLSKMHENDEHWVAVTVICDLTKIKSITEDRTIVLKAIRKSPTLILNDVQTHVRRPNFAPPKPQRRKNLRRTVFLYGIPPNFNEENINEMCKEYGKIKSITFDRIESNVLAVEIKDVQSDKTEEELEVQQSKKISNKSEKLKDNQEEKNEKNEKNEKKEDNALKTTKVKKMENDNYPIPNRDVAIAIMTKRFGTKAVRSNSAKFENVLTSNEKALYLAQKQFQGTSMQVKLPENVKKSMDNKIMTAEFQSKVAEKATESAAISDNPLDFSHLRSCFIVFESQSQANKCVKNRCRAHDGIRAMHQYDYNQFFKRVSLQKARGISPLISPGTINLAMNSPSFSMMSHRKHYNNDNNDLNNLSNMAQSMRHSSQRPRIMKYPKRPRTAPHSHYKNKRNTYHHFQKQGNSFYQPRQTWSHGQNYRNEPIFDFEPHNYYEPHNNNGNNRKNYKNINYRRSASHSAMSHKHFNGHRNGNGHWNHDKHYQGRIPPPPTLDQFRYNGNANAAAFKITSNAPRFHSYHYSPNYQMHEPEMTSFVVPDSDCGIMNRAHPFYY